MYSYGPPHMAVQKQDDQHEHTFSSYVRIRDVVLKTYLGRWTIGRSGERGSGISVLLARYDDDDDWDISCKLPWYSLKCVQKEYIFTKIMNFFNFDYLRNIWVAFCNRTQAWYFVLIAVWLFNVRPYFMFMEVLLVKSDHSPVLLLEWLGRFKRNCAWH